MATLRADRIAANYRTRIRALHAETARRVAAAYRAKIRQDAIMKSFEDDFAPLAVRTISAGQGAVQTTTRAYIRGVGGADPLPVERMAGTSKAGTMLEALVGIAPFILGAIGRGESVDSALGIGQSYVERMTDNELTRVVDAEIEGQRDRARGWEGITAAPSDACVGNAGFHTFDEEIYRHPGCNCIREVVFA